jgi:hypothetical protein
VENSINAEMFEVGDVCRVASRCVSFTAASH